VIKLYYLNERGLVMEKSALFELAIEISKRKYETQTLEVKSAASDCPRRLFSTLSSFSNQDSGGTIIFGIDEKSGFSIIGVYDIHDLQRRVSEQCEQMYPICRPFFTVADIDGKMIVSAEIPPIDYAERPCYYRGAGMIKGSFIRTGESDHLMTNYEVYRYEAYRKRTRDDLRVVDKTIPQLLNEEKLSNFLKLVKREKVNLSAIDDNKALDIIGITRDGKATLTGWILFADYPQSMFPQFCVTAVVLPGTLMGETDEMGARFIDNKRFDGDFRNVFEETEKFIIRNMRNRVIINDKGKRIDQYEYPITAIREILLNALMHRDYSSYSENMPVAIEMYRDRIEITNPGGLYGRINVYDLGKTKTETRNATLVNVLEIMRIAENRHSGIPTVRRVMLDSDLPAPIFEDARGVFKVTLRNHFSDLFEFCQKPRSRSEIATFLNITPDYAMTNRITPLLSEGKLAMTIPDKPKSKLQKYYTVSPLKSLSPTDPL